MSSICLQLLSRMLSIAFAFTCLLNIWLSGYSDCGDLISTFFFFLSDQRLKKHLCLCRVQSRWRRSLLNKVAVYSSKHMFPACHDPLLGQEPDRSWMSNLIDLSWLFLCERARDAHVECNTSSPLCNPTWQGWSLPQVPSKVTEDDDVKPNT